MTFDQQLNMTYRAEIGRGEWKLPVVRTVLSEASQQVMQIHVDGSVEHPNIRREAFPGVNQALQQLQAELQTPGAPPPAPPQARRLLPALLKKHLEPSQEPSRGLAHFALPCEQNVPNPFSAEGSRIGS
jgi:hypothetical protein